jgi:hypothetical protein
MMISWDKVMFLFPRPHVVVRGGGLPPPKLVSCGGIEVGIEGLKCEGSGGGGGGSLL